jgi:hypothetical protein
MREPIKVFAVVVFAIAGVATAVVWSDDRPTSTTHLLRYACPAIAVLAVGFVLRIHFRADDAPDYLRQLFGTYFNRDGFCFGVLPAARNGVCYFDVYFQNQYANPSVACVALRPARGFFGTRANVDSIAIELTCEPAAFGVARVAVPIPQHLQGQRQGFEVGASVSYPSGKGRRLRFADGLTLRANSNFQNGMASALAVSVFVTGTVVLVRPATLTLALPANVADGAADFPSTKIHTLWKLGESLLEQG